MVIGHRCYGYIPTIMPWSILEPSLHAVMVDLMFLLDSKGRDVAEQLTGKHGTAYLALGLPECAAVLGEN